VSKEKPCETCITRFKYPNAEMGLPMEKRTCYSSDSDGCANWKPVPDGGTFQTGSGWIFTVCGDCIRQGDRPGCVNIGPKGCVNYISPKDLKACADYASSKRRK